MIYLASYEMGNPETTRTSVCATTLRFMARRFQVWLPRHGKSNRSTSYIWQNERRTEIVAAGTGRGRAYDLEG